MTNFVELLQRMQTKRAAGNATETAQSQEEQHQEQTDETGPDESDDAGIKAAQEKQARQVALCSFADKVAALTEKVAAIVRDGHDEVAEQLFRNLVSASMHMKLAGMTHQSFEQPDTLVRGAYDLMLSAADTLDLQLK